LRYCLSRALFYDPTFISLLAWLLFEHECFKVRIVSYFL
jgi:hypothetical protein